MTFKELVNNVVVPIVDGTIIPLLFALAFIMFLVGIVRYFFLGGEEAREAGKQFILWGIIGFVVISSLWGIVKLLLSVFSLESASGV